MKNFDFMAGITLLLVAAVQAASVWGLVTGQLTFDAYLATWSPIATLVLGYWFRGTQQETPK